MRNITIVNKTDGATFYNAINLATKTCSKPNFVDIYSSEAYENMENLILLNDGECGLGITKEKDIISVFKNKELSKINNAIRILIPLAITMGGGIFKLFR